MTMPGQAVARSQLLPQLRAVWLSERRAVDALLKVEAPYQKLRAAVERARRAWDRYQAAAERALEVLDELRGGR